MEDLKCFRDGKFFECKIDICFDGCMILLCPECKGEREHEYLNISTNFWGVCNTCKTRWLIGDNFDSSWRKQTEEIWEANYQKIKDYQEVYPFKPGVTKYLKFQIDMVERNIRAYELERDFAERPQDKKRYSAIVRGLEELLKELNNGFYC